MSAHPAAARSREPPPLQLFSYLSHHPCTGRAILYTGICNLVNVHFFLEGIFVAHEECGFFFWKEHVYSLLGMSVLIRNTVYVLDQA